MIESINNSFQEIIINEQEAKNRLDKFLGQRLNNLSRNKIEKYIKQGIILVNNHKVKPSYHLKNNDHINLPASWPQDHFQLIPLPLIPEPAIIYEDENILVINKPPFVLVHPTIYSLSHPSIASWFIAKYPNVKNVGDNYLRPGIVHRLDKDTSGMLILTKNQKTFEYFKSLFAQRRIEKIYLVLVKGELKKSDGIITFNIDQSKSFPKRKSIISKQYDSKIGKEALTYFHAIQHFSHYTLLEVRPKTGRTHQIRVHLASIGFPVAGDRLYGKIKMKEKLLFPRQMIHAFKITFPYFNNKLLTLTAPLPEDFLIVISKLTNNSKL